MYRSTVYLRAGMHTVIDCFKSELKCSVLRPWWNERGFEFYKLACSRQLSVLIDCFLSEDSLQIWKLFARLNHWRPILRADTRSLLPAAKPMLHDPDDNGLEYPQHFDFNFFKSLEFLVGLSMGWWCTVHLCKHVIIRGFCANALNYLCNSIINGSKKAGPWGERTEGVSCTLNFRPRASSAPCSRLLHTCVFITFKTTRQYNATQSECLKQLSGLPSRLSQL